MATKECYICYESLEDNIKELKCKHKFHPCCVNKWLEINITCPICRETVIDARDHFPYTSKIYFPIFRI